MAIYFRCPDGSSSGCHNTYYIKITAVGSIVTFILIIIFILRTTLGTDKDGKMLIKTMEPKKIALELSIYTMPTWIPLLGLIFFALAGKSSHCRRLVDDWREPERQNTQPHSATTFAAAIEEPSKQLPCTHTTSVV